MDVRQYIFLENLSTFLRNSIFVFRIADGTNLQKVHPEVSIFPPNCVESNSVEQAYGFC
jgi:hypothetical protein